MPPKLIVTRYNNDNTHPIPDGGKAYDDQGANYASCNRQGLLTHECACGQHLWALPWEDDMNNWVRHLRSPLRAMYEANGFAPPPPTFSHHVILASPEDEHLLKLRRWRVFPTRGGCRAKYQLQSGPRGLPLHRMVMAGAKIVRFKNRNGLDCRWSNLLKMTQQQVAAECRTRKAAKRKAQPKVPAATI